MTSIKTNEKEEKMRKTFEQSLQELEKIVRALEAGNIGLDESLDKFEEGVKLYKNCRSTLDKAEKKIRVLNESLKELDYGLESE